MMKIVHYLTVMLAVALSATACSYTNYFLDEDEETQDDAVPYQTLEDVSCFAYDSWTYINLETGEMEVCSDTSEWIYTDGSTREEQEEEEISIDWHIAVHRYEIKTNGASVLNTGETDMLSVTELPEGDYIPDSVQSYEDELEKGSDETQYLLITDMSGMMDGNLGYIHYPTINLALCNGIIRTATGSMPPTIYSTDEEVFALKWDDGTWAALQITETYSSGGASGYLSFNYQYYSE